MIKKNNNDITHVYHLADIHIRNLQRHKEYRLVFEQFLKQVKEDNIENSVIYLAGDIAHAKTELSPELVQEVSWLFKECANLHDTFVITGNHDCNLNNSYRLDVLTPIIENLNHPNLHYLRDTGTTKFKNLTFTVYSILDHKNNWPSGYDVAGENSICLFHGPVNKAETDIGYTVASNSFTVDMFDGFDFAMLGDIHKRQVLQNYSEMEITCDKDDIDSYREAKWKIIDGSLDADKFSLYKKTPIVAYAGSVVQQNHGELLEKHGYLLWDIKEKTFEEFHIHNDYGYLTIDVDNGVIPQWVYDEIDTVLPKNPRLRLRFKDTEAFKMKLCILELKKMFDHPEVTVTRTDTLSSLRTGNKLNKNIVGEVNEITFQNHLIRDYLERQYLLENSDLDKIAEINIEINNRLGDNALADNILWTPKKFEFDNMFSYGKDNIIDFENARDIIGIFAPNAQGKSSLFDALSFCIFDKSSRTNNSKNILNNKSDSFYCKFQFDIDGINYFIERTAKWTRKKTALKVDVNFWKEDAGIIQSLNGEQRRDTNKNIEKYLGKFEDFVLTSLSLQGNDALFIDKKQSERKEILSQFIGVDVFDKLYQIASSENKDNATLIRKFKADDFTSRLNQLVIDYNISTQDFKEASKELKEVDKDVEKWNGKVIKLNGQIVKLNSDLVGINELTKRHELLSTKKVETHQNKQLAENRIEKIEDLQIKLDDMLDDYDEEDLEEKLDRLNRGRSRAIKVGNEIEKTNIKIEAAGTRKLHLEKHKYDPNCEICMENASSVIESKKDVNLEIGELQESLKTHTNEIESLRLLTESLLQAEIDWANYLDAKGKETKVNNELSNLINQVSAYESDEIRLETQIKAQTDLIDEFYNHKSQIEKNRVIREKLIIVSADLQSSRSKSAVLSKKVLQLNGKVASLKSQRETIEDRIREVKDLEKQTKLYDYYLNALSKDGVSYELIEKALPMIEGEVNNILGQIVEFGMRLDITGKNINAYLVYGDEQWSLEMCSGMERFISGLAIRVALINICNLPRPNFLVIDEGFGTLDSENMQSLFQLFTYLKTQFDFVMVISHIDTMRDAVDNLIEIKKTDGFSKIKF